VREDMSVLHASMQCCGSGQFFQILGSGSDLINDPDPSRSFFSILINLKASEIAQNLEDLKNCLLKKSTRMYSVYPPLDHFVTILDEL